MSFKNLKRIICTAAIAGVAVAVPLMSGCNTDHPEAEIKLEFNGVTYVLEYKMYRNMYPQTVQHFIELADNGFYNDTIIHDYKSTSAWYGGGYAYSENYETSYEEGIESLQDYLDANLKEASYVALAQSGALTPSVYVDNNLYDTPLYTLIGEFSNNQHKIDNGALKKSFGALSTYYTAKTLPDDVNGFVLLDKQGSDKGVRGEYKYNCTTSLFSIQTSTSTSSADSSYCLFAELQNKDVLTDMRTAVSKEITSSDSQDVHTYVDYYDHFVEARTNEVTYKLTEKPIIVRSVKITKY